MAQGEVSADDLRQTARNGEYVYPVFLSERILCVDNRLHKMQPIEQGTQLASLEAAIATVCDTAL